MDIKPPRFQKKRQKSKGLIKFETQRTTKAIEDAKMHVDAVLKSLDKRTNISMHHPKRIVIVSTWRSGSTFMADLINSLPLTWYHYEPLNVLGIKQVRSKEEPAVSWINSLIYCNYTNLDKYINYFRTNPDLYYYNKEWRTICKSKFNSACLHSHVLQKMCSLYTIQVLKTVRVRLRLLQNILQDPSVKIIYLVRDPRGTIQSRKHREWCPTSPDCFKSELLCSDLVDDYQTATTLRLKYPQQFMGLNQLPLPDQDIGVELFDGQMTGLTNLSRRGNAILHAEKDQIILSFTLQARDLRAAYSWKKQRLKGKVVAILNRTILNVQIKQCFSSTKSPKIHLFQVQEVDGIQVTICGLGPLNWIIKKALRSLLRRHVRSWIENDLKEVLQRELYNVSIGDELSCALFYNNESLYHPNKKVV
ncbi:uncharacterized protein [Lepeophtheirus salmonis]